MLRQHDAIVAEDRGMLDGVFQLSNVAGPRILQEAIQTRGVES